MKKYKIKVSKGRFTTDGDWFKEGDEFISVNINTHNAGMGSPCKDKADTIKTIKDYLFSKGKVELSDIELINTSGLDITTGEILGYSLNQWF